MPGSKPGECRGGRKKGTPNRVTAKRESDIAASGLTPLEYLLGVLRESKDEAMRFEAAKAAAPYVHPRLSNINAKHDLTDGVTELLKAIDGRTRGIPSAS